MGKPHELSSIVKYRCPLCKKSYCKDAMIFIEDDGEIIDAWCQPCDTKREFVSLDEAKKEILSDKESNPTNE